MLPIADLLHLEPELSIDRRLLRELLDVAFMGKDTGTGIDRTVAEAEIRSTGWQAEFYLEDLFVEDFLAQCFEVKSAGSRYTVNRAFHLRVLSDPPTEPKELKLRQGIVAELGTSASARKAAHHLYRELYDLMAMLKLPGHAARLDINAFRLDILRRLKWAVDFMVSDFAGCTSALRRLAETGQEIQKSKEYGLLAALLDYEGRLSSLNVDINIGASGRVNGLRIREITENEGNRFHRGPWRRLRDRLRFLWRGYEVSRFEVVSRLVQKVFGEVADLSVHLVQVLAHLELYLANDGFRQIAAERGLELCLPSVGEEEAMRLEGLFNPLLLMQAKAPVPSTVEKPGRGSVTVITGPNSGGKTRLLQALGLSQLLGQSGLYVPAKSGTLTLYDGLFVSLIEREVVDQEEGRLGRELMRIRTMFEAMGPRSMVMFDELCSGTNPSEAIEVFALVLRLLERLTPLAFISTHFLDYARELERQPPIGGMEFLQVEVGGGQRSTYQFVPGVAQTSMAAAMAKRLGVTFEELTSTVEERRQARQPSEEAQRGDRALVSAG